MKYLVQPSVLANQVQYLVQPVQQTSYAYPGVDQSRVYTIAAVHSGLVAGVRNGAIVLEQQQWDEAASQQWRFVPASQGFNIINVGTGNLMDVEGNSTADGASVIEYPSNGGRNQMWTLNYLGASRFGIQSVSSGKLLDVQGVSSQEGAPIIQWTSNEGDNQKWRISEVLDITASPAYSSQVTIYEHANYAGANMSLGLGRYTVAELQFPDNTLSSLKIPQGMRVTLFESDTFRGDVLELTADTAYVGDEFNDKTSALLVELVATAYTEPNFGGRSQAFSIGSYNIGDLTIGNDAIASIRVPVGMQVILIQDADFKGNRKVVFNDVPDLGDFKGQTSSMHVKMMGLVVPNNALAFGNAIAVGQPDPMRPDDVTDYIAITSSGQPGLSQAAEYECFLTIVRAGATTLSGLLCYGDVVALRTYNNAYLSARAGGSVDSSATDIGDEQRWIVTRAGFSDSRTVVAKNDQIALRSVAHNTYLHMGGTPSYPTVDAAPTSLGQGSTWGIGNQDPPPPPCITDGGCGSYGCPSDGPMPLPAVLGRELVRGAAQHLAKGLAGMPVIFGECSVEGCNENACPADGCLAQGYIVHECGADACGAAFCGAQASIVNACGAAGSGLVVCGMDVSGVVACGADACGAAACLNNACGVDACAAAACGADGCAAAACGAAACAAAACGAAGCGAAGCAVDACPLNYCSVEGCAADGCVVATGPSFGGACGANGCVIDLCPADACAADGCVIDIIPIIPGI